MQSICTEKSESIEGKTNKQKKKKHKQTNPTTNKKQTTKTQKYQLGNKHFSAEEMYQYM